MNERENIKPVTLLKEDLVNGLVNLCNNSGLPFFVIEYILKDLYLEVKNLAAKQYESDLVKYKSDLAKYDNTSNDE